MLKTKQDREWGGVYILNIASLFSNFIFLF